jgi:hypothetical protein
MNSPNIWPHLTKRPESDEPSRRGRAADEGGIVALFTSVLRDSHERRGSFLDCRGAGSGETKGVA